MNKGIAFGLGVVAVALVIGAIVFQAGQEPSPDAPAVLVDKGLTPETTEAFGAAIHVPDDVSSYSSSMQLLSRWQGIWESNAVQNLVKLPTLQQLLMQAQQHPSFTSLMQTLNTHPLAVEGLPVLRDAMSNEVFVCTGPDVPELLDALGDLYGEINAARLDAALTGLGGRPAGFDTRMSGIIEAVLENEDRLKMPSMLIGCRLKNVDAATQFLDSWIPRISTTPVGEIQNRSIKDAPFYVLNVSGTQLPGNVARQISESLKSSPLAPDQQQRLMNFIQSQNVSVAVGVLDEYLMFSLGSDTSLLERWGAASSLAESEMFSPVRTHYKDGLASLNYIAASMTPRQLTAEDVENLAEYLLDAASQMRLPPELPDRVRQDVKLLASEIVPTDPHATLSFSFDNQGIESYTFGGPFPASLDGSKPLSLLAHQGQHPIVASAARAAESPDVYDQAVKWIKTGFSYFEDFVVVTMPPEDRVQYEEGLRIAMPFVKSLDAATRDHLVPAVDGTQSLFIFDGQGSLASLPDGNRLEPPFPVPRLGAAIELNDADQFKSAIAEYSVASRKLIADIRTAYPSALPPEFRVPDAQTSDLAGGTMYHYSLPVDLGPDLFPCSLLKDRLLVLASSSRLAEEFATEQPMPSSAVIGIDKNAGSAMIVSYDELWDYLHRVSDSGFTLAQKANPRSDPQMMTVIKTHVDAVLRSLSALRSYQSTTTQLDGRIVTHSWLHVEDIGR